ncbi:hypothetical protein PVAND_015398 [Polypedilum vanderplanki]|uniref:Ankyrin repeat protein n=1 Tax=Polypedilum vanderplanki TaxID=319348 RepID=A0A9J6BC21_POLVA|nr:hypothetical protein PVAND_015398 [Polypedilum vanderplanki]
MDSKATTVLTNLQRGNIEAKISTSISLSFHEKCGQGEIDEEDLKSSELINLPDEENKFTPLHWACSYGQLKTAEKLLKYRANPNALAKNYISPLHLAAAGGHHEVVRLLIVHNANINQLDIDGNSPLHFAAFGNFPHSTNEILQSGKANILQSNSDGKSAYTLAIENKAHLAQAVIENYISSIIG